MPGNDCHDNPTIRERLATVEAEVRNNSKEIGEVKSLIHQVFDAIDGLREAAFTNQGAVKATCKIGCGLIAIAGLAVAAAKHEAVIKLWRSIFNGG